MKTAASPVLKGDKELAFPHALLISASAGSGKTYTLTQRYVQFLLSERVPDNGLQNILAVTFTNNAAKEMKARILAWLKELALDPASPKMEETLWLVSLPRAEVHRRAVDLVERIIANYSDFHIQTIDSFLARVMAASADELKLPLRAEITMAYDALTDLALYSLFSRIGRPELPAEAVDKFLAVLPKTGSYPWNPVQRVKEHFNSFLTQEGKSAGLLAAPDGDYEALLKARFEAAADFCGGLVKRYGARDLFKEKILAALEARSVTDFLAAYKFDYSVFNGARRARLPEGWEKDRDHANELALELMELNAAAYYHPYVGIYDRFKAELERAKRGKNDVIHINDIAKRLASYINASNVPEVYLKLGERISHFLIDEFQDTNRLQWDVIRPLVEEGLSKSGSLFVVGDIKQAIYMFRNADYKIMRDLLDKAEGKKAEASNISLSSLGNRLDYVNLPVNYRSDGNVLAHVDRLFKEKLKGSELAGEDITELTSYEQAVQPGRLKHGYVRTDVLELESLDDTREQKRWLLDAVNAARARYPLGEIAILAGKNKRIEPVVEWLTEAGIPVASLSSLDIRKRKVITELVACLRFLETPSDDLAFAEVITGGAFARLTGLGREEMDAFIAAARAADRDALLYVAFRERYPAAWEACLAEPFRKVGYLPLYELVSLLFASFKVFDNFPGEQAFLARFLDAVSALEAQGVNGPRAFIEYASGADEDKAAAFSIALPDYLDAVRVMTFHKSKGLGFSVVINLLYEEKGVSDPMYFEERDGAINVYHITKAAAEASVKLRPVYEGRRADAAVQDLNVLYVVSTRARHELYNLVVRKARKTEAKEPRLLDLFEPGEIGKPAPHIPARRQPAAPVKVSSAPVRVEERFEAFKPTYASYKEIAEGELAHAILARFKEPPDDLEAALASACDDLAPLFPFTFDKPRLLRSLADFLNSSEGMQLFLPAPGREVLTEAEFIDKNGALFRMDRVLVDPEQVTVIDFKTGRENNAAYATQMKNYLAIAAQAYGRPARGLLAYVELFKVVPV
jgi:ATP-dependent exoDNAse (exonuclease V) beta subunit